MSPRIKRIQCRCLCDSSFQKARRSTPLVEILEDRRLLAVGVPMNVIEESSELAVFAPGLSRFSLAQGSIGAAQMLFRFSGDSKFSTYDSVFRLHPDHSCADNPSVVDLSSPCSQLDVGIGVYDEAGNLLASSDVGVDAPAVETLELQLLRQTPYLLGLFFGSPGPAADFILEVGLGEQPTNLPIHVDPTTGQAMLSAVGGEDLFNSRADADYYPVETLNLGAHAAVNGLPLGIDAAVAGRVFRFDATYDAWVPADGQALPTAFSNPNGEFSLQLVAPGDENLTDSHYMLAVVPAGLSSAAGAYQVSVDGSAFVLGPATTPAQSVHDLTTLSPVSLGTSEAVVAADLLGMDEQTYRFRVPHELAEDADVGISVETTSFAPLISVYDIDSKQILHASSRRSAGALSTTIPGAVAGDEFYVRVGAVDKMSPDSEEFQLTITAAYEPTELPIGSTVSTMSGLFVGPSVGARIYRVDPSAETDVLSLHVASSSDVTDPGALAPTVKLVGATGMIVESAVAPGDDLTIVADVRNLSGPFDLYLGASEGTQPATLQIAAVEFEETFAFGELASTSPGLASGDFNVMEPSPSFGQSVGREYYQQLTQPDALTLIQATATGGAIPVIGYYEREQGQLRLTDLGLPDPNSAVTETRARLIGTDRHAVVGWNVGLNSNPGSQISLSIDGPTPIPIEVGMVPDLDQDPASGTFQSIMKLDDMTLEADFQNHLVKTILPANMTDLPRVTFEPESSLSAVVRVYDADGLATGTPMEELVMPPDVNSSFTIDGSCTNSICRQFLVDILAGQELWVVVDPVEGQLGDGVYSLRMTVETEEPFPFELLEKAWRFPSSTLLNDDGENCNPLVATHDSNPPFLGVDAPARDDPDAKYRDVGGGSYVPCVGTFPDATDGTPMAIVDVIQNQYGDGMAEGVFTSELPYTQGTDRQGAIDVFRFWATNPGPVSVRTVAQADPANPDARPVNTTLKLYRAVFGANGAVDHLVEMNEVYASRDWFGADRSIVDAQTYVNDFDLLAYETGQGCSTACYGASGGGMYFAVVKNQEGSLGRYQLEVDAPSFMLNEVAVVPPSRGGTVRMNAAEAASVTQFVGYYAIQLPDYHDGSLSLNTPPMPRELGRWHFDLFDGEGKIIPGDINYIVSGDFGTTHTTAQFDVPLGPQTLTLRVAEQTENSTGSYVDVSVELMKLARGVEAPPVTLRPATVQFMLPTDPFGDGSVSSQSSAQYVFQAPAGEISVQVVPDKRGTTLRWGVYADTDGDRVYELLAWDQTSDESGRTTETHLLLPEPRQPVRVHEYAYDREYLGHQNSVSVAPYQDVVIFVEQVDGIGRYTVTVDSNASPPVCLTSSEEVQPTVVPFTAYPDGTPTARTWTEALQSPTLGLVECASEKPMRNRLVHMNPLSTTANVSFSGVRGLEWTTFTVPDYLDTEVPMTLSVTPRSPGTMGVTGIGYWIYNYQGQLVLSGTGTATLAGPAVFEFPVERISGADQEDGAIAPGRAYYLRTGVSADAADLVDVSLSASLPKFRRGSDNQPTSSTIDELESLTFARLQVSPSGVVEDLGFTNGAFWVGQAGIARFETTARSTGFDGRHYVALYRGKDVRASELGTYRVELELVDFANETTRISGKYVTEAYVEPGLYFLATVQTAGSLTKSFIHNFDLPDYVPERVVLDPNFGDSQSLLRNTDVALHPTSSADLSIAEEYRSTYYEVQAPPGSLAGTIAYAMNFSCPNFDMPDRAFLSVWQEQDDEGFVRFDSETNYIHPPQGTADDPNCIDGQIGSATPSVAVVRPMDEDGPIRAFPFDEFVIALDRRDLATKIGLEGYFEVPESGTPDLVVESVSLLPNDGETRVEVTVRNVGYASAPLSQAMVTRSNYSDDQETRNEYPLGPFASRTRYFPWLPNDPSDTVMYTTDLADEIEELSEDNNSVQVALSTVDAHRPEVMIQLGTPSRDGEPGDVWGRYISKVPGVTSNIEFVVTDGDDLPVDTDGDGLNDHYRSWAYYPSTQYVEVENQRRFGPESTAVVEHFDLGMLFPTISSVDLDNPNEFRLQATDRYGLTSDLAVEQAHVEPSLGWLKLEGSNSGIVFDPNTNQYELTFHNNLIDFPEDPNQRSLSQLTGVSIPFVGDKGKRLPCRD